MALAGTGTNAKGDAPCRSLCGSAVASDKGKLPRLITKKKNDKYYGHEDGDKNEFNYNPKTKTGTDQSITCLNANDIIQILTKSNKP